MSAFNPKSTDSAIYRVKIRGLSDPSNGLRNYGSLLVILLTRVLTTFSGFEDLTTFPGKKEMRVEFKSTEDAVTCVGELQGFKVEPQFSLNILYG